MQISSRAKALAQRSGWAHLLLALVVTFPLLRRPTTHLIGSENVDVWNHAWGPWWWATCLQEGQIPFQTRYLAWPDGGALWFIDPFLAGIGAPLLLLIGQIASFNLVVLLYVTFASWAVWRLAEAMGASRGARWIASVVFVASAWVTCALHNGITESANIGPVALALAWTEDAARGRTRRLWAKAGVGVGLASLASPYLGLGTAIAALLRGLPHIRRAWAGGLVAFAVAAPPLAIFRTQLAADDAIIKHPGSMNVQLALHNAVDPRNFVTPFGFRSVDLSHEGFEHSMYLGLAALTLCLLALFLRRLQLSWFPSALACLIAALGPFLYWGDGWLILNGSMYRLPWGYVQDALPSLALTHPLRLGVPALAIIAAWSALGADALANWLPRQRKLVLPALATILALDGLIISGAPWPIETAKATPPEVYEIMERAPGTPMVSGILDLPTEVGATMQTSRYLTWQSAHRQGIPYAPDARAITSSLRSEPPFRVLAEFSDLRPDEKGRNFLPYSGPGGIHTSRLKNHDIRWIVVHTNLDPSAAQATIEKLEEDLGPGTVVNDEVYWDLADWL